MVLTGGRRGRADHGTGSVEIATLLTLRHFYVCTLRQELVDIERALVQRCQVCNLRCTDEYFKSKRAGGEREIAKRIEEQCRAFWRRKEYEFEYRRERVQLRQRIGKVLPGEWRRILRAYDNRCAYCGKPPVPPAVLAIDHVIPIIKGGTNDPANLVPACKSCNSRKHARTILTNKNQLLLWPTR